MICSINLGIFTGPPTPKSELTPCLSTKASNGTLNVPSNYNNKRIMNSIFL